MHRRSFLATTLQTFGVVACGATMVGCRGRQTAHVLDDHDKDMVGSHEAGSATFGPLVSESVAKLLGREYDQVQHVSYDGSFDAGPKKICFVGVENDSIEELGDFHDQIYELIDAEISRSGAFDPISRRYMEPALRNTGLRPDDLFLPNESRLFAAELERQGMPIDYLLYAKLTSGTTNSNRDYQRDYLLTLDLVNIHNGRSIKENAEIRKGYHKSKLGQWAKYNPFAR